MSEETWDRWLVRFGWVPMAVIVFAAVVAFAATNFRSSPAERAVEDPVKRFVDAIRRHDREQACSLLATGAKVELRRREEARSCEGAVEGMIPRDASWSGFGEIRFGPGQQRARVPSVLADRMLDEAVDHGTMPSALDLASASAIPPIHLESFGGSRWWITTLGWYFKSQPNETVGLRE